MDIKKEYLDLNDNFSYHKASAADWRGIGYMEIPSGADIYFMEWFYKEIQEGKWLVWDKHQDSWKPCDYDFREDCPNIHWKREGVTLKKALDKSISNKTVPEGFVLVPHDVAERCMGHISIAMCHPNNTNAENDVMQMDLDILESRVEAQEQSHD